MRTEGKAVSTTVYGVSPEQAMEEFREQQSVDKGRMISAGGRAVAPGAYVAQKIGGAS